MSCGEEHKTAEAPQQAPEGAHPCANPATQDYDSRLAAERKVYDPQTDVHDLPAVSHYWSDKFIRPMV
jgi:hypothetical protein